MQTDLQTTYSTLISKYVISLVLDLPDGAIINGKQTERQAFRQICVLARMLMQYEMA